MPFINAASERSVNPYKPKFMGDTISSNGVSSVELEKAKQEADKAEAARVAKEKSKAMEACNGSTTCEWKVWYNFLGR